jgi:hypothetical protein
MNEALKNEEIIEAARQATNKSIETAEAPGEKASEKKSPFILFLALSPRIMVTLILNIQQQPREFENANVILVIGWHSYIPPVRSLNGCTLCLLFNSN